MEKKFLVGQRMAELRVLNCSTGRVDLFHLQRWRETTAQTKKEKKKKKVNVLVMSSYIDSL